MKALLVIIFSFSFSQLFAEDCIDCVKSIAPFSQVVKSVEVLQGSIEIKCDDQLKDDAQKEYLALFSAKPQVEGVVKGLRLLGSEEEIQILNKMLRDNPVEEWQKTQSCNTVLCALTKMYDSLEAAHRVLNIAARDGYIVSAAREFKIEGKDQGQLFSLSEIQKIDLAYKRIPTIYKKLRSLNRIKRLPNGYSQPRAPDAVAYSKTGREGEITFLDSGFEGSASWGPTVAVHELSHHVDFSRSPTNVHGFSEAQEFLSLSGWSKKVSYEVDERTNRRREVVEWSHDPDKKFVTSYGSTEPAEDFAESATYYIYKPNQLKAADPQKYEFLKNNVFSGKEYLNSIVLSQGQNASLKNCIDNTGASKQCLDKLIADFKYTDPKMCSLNPEQIRDYLEDGLR